ncbi:MAG: hypothetical protein PWQ67_2510 [Clostridia bacterium]|nr:hypothetical protein [Clostridia bacterium]
MGRYTKILTIDETLQTTVSQQKSSQDFEEQKLRHMLDPREDLRKDSKLWVRLLYNAYHFNKEVYGVLHGLRCGGAQITLTPESFKLLPGEWTVQEWEENKSKYLDPIKKELIKIFKISRIGKIVNEEIPEGIFTKQVLKHEKLNERLVFGVDRGE